ncbi:LysR family transcriptional regulator [Microbacterium mangrovi]|uniref:LysR family transcriptional regulator n=1 Tax=Microbacterium mangrovi TaxID=1348253 RepID=A0A0B2A8G6_9MICO|nr:LysR family transcriptional regulator [Microbacterium mangrovi]KHK99828.1 LysR family transcriptional regulator [Microbacterium mangrovi]
MIPFDLVSLDLLVDIADAGTLTAGAVQGNMTPSAASQRIARLERSVGQPLFERLPRGIRLTEAGLVLATRARVIRRELKAAVGDLQALEALERGSVRLGSFPTASASFLSDALKDAHRTWPGIDITVRSALRPELLDMLDAGEIEMAILWDYDWTEETATSLTLAPLTVDETVLLVPAESALQDGVTVRSLGDEHWVTRNGGHPAAEILARSCAAAGIVPRIAYAAYDYQEVQAMVAARMGIAMVPRLAIATHRPDVRIVAFGPAENIPARRIHLAWPARRTPTPSMRALADVVTRAARLH